MKLKDYLKTHNNLDHKMLYLIRIDKNDLIKVRKLGNELHITEKGNISYVNRYNYRDSTKIVDSHYVFDDVCNSKLIDEINMIAESLRKLKEASKKTFNDILNEERRKALVRAKERYKALYGDIDAEKISLLKKELDKLITKE